MTLYDSDVLQAEADRIYSSADSGMWFCTIAGVAVGAVCYAALVQDQLTVQKPGWAACVVIGIPGIIGFMIGRHAAHRLRLKAQLILVQVQIEKNTRAVNSNKAQEPTR